ncbi:MAG: M42 family metallopeptidase [Clostridiales bacterium]|nr:M42 family metallopeptidase [Clostridiales bacterium]
MMLDTLKTMLAAYGPTGREGLVAEEVKKLLQGKVDTMETDVMGNLICVKKGQEGGKTIMFSAHMDHIGLVVTDIEDTGFLRVTNVGGIGIDSMKGHHVTFGNGVEGIVMLQPTKGEAASLSHLFVDIGAEDKADALTKVNLGDVCVYAPDCVQLGQYRVASPAMDDRCACALLCELLMQAENPKNTIVGVFSTQEEVGLRGATTAAYQVAPDLGVGLDVTAWGDTPETKLPAVKLGAGAAIKFLDRSMIATPVVRDALIAAAEKAGAAYQREVLPFGGTDGAAIQHARGGIPAGTLSIPCRYVHSACETIDMRDMDSALCILKEFVNGTY